MNKNFSNLGFYPANILLPNEAQMEKWSVVACDQFTSQPEYWAEAENIVGDKPSTLRLILPEVKLGSDGVDEEIKAINENMGKYLEAGVFKTLEDSLIYVERTQSDGKVRHGLVGMVDLEQYDFTPGSGALIRATEGTVLSRIPPRVKVRENAPIELPHVMLLIDDPDRTVIEPLTDAAQSGCGCLEKIYDYDLMLGGGHICGYKVGAEKCEAVAKALEALKSPEAMERKYGMGDSAPLLFAVGDGNHSLATAKQCYENLKKVTPESEWASLPARYALVEVVNNHDDALKFEPIHRTLFGVDAEDVIDSLMKAYPGSVRIAQISALEVSAEEILKKAGEAEDVSNAQIITYHFAGETGVVVITKPTKQLAVGTLQAFLDDYLADKKAEIDYVHGDDVVMELGSREGNLSFLLPAMGKEQLFKTVMADGVLPRKTFSMGHAQDKRYYTEARKIR
ncbi:MAG: DUF1015 domain-containing protein [Lachnospiraceae bacterium]|nr:DUF1015 domain-containing protein [Lachnospiraceae bacterium]